MIRLSIYVAFHCSKPVKGDLREPPSFVVPKIALLLAVMEHCELQEVDFCSTIGSCPGMLISDDFFVEECLAT